MIERCALLFPGQGTLPDSLPDTPVGGRLLARAERSGVLLRSWLGAREAAPACDTEYAQPLIFIDSVGKGALLRDRGLRPEMVAGHSLGEYAALVFAGVLAPEEGLDLVVERGRAMGSVAGAMAAILKLSASDVEHLCERVPEATIANINGERQIVVSGTESGIAAVSAAAERQGGRAVRLMVSGPFHSPLMSEASERFAPALDRASFRDATIPIVSAVTGRPETDGSRLRELMKRQMLACVRWFDVMRWIASQGVTCAIEAGPGTVLAGLGRRIVPAMRFVPYEEA